MCGIAGIFNINNKNVILDDLKKMTDVIVHRGPDGEGHWINDKCNIGFGHRRLSIIDLSINGKQPMHYADERYTITFNGEIYNYIELRENLIKQGYLFKSDSDTEVLLALYDLKKENCLLDLDGMFSFAIWDEQEQLLFCARDRFGEKPFHYYLDEKQFVFASEIKQFWEIGLYKEMSEHKIKNYVLNGIIEDPKDLTSTFYKGIKKLDAAHYLIIKKDKSFNIKQYWTIDLNTPKFKGSIEQAAEQFFDLFKQSIRLRLRSDVPVGSSLSGGLDSSSIVMLIDLLKGKDTEQNTFSARFKNYAKDEGKYIDEVSKTCDNLTVYYTWPDKDYFKKVFDDVAYHQDEPFGSASIVAQYAVMELAKQNNVTVLLDGQGADEVMAGYIPYYNIYLDQLSVTNKKLFKDELESFKKLHNSTFTYTSLKDKESIRMTLGRHKKLLLGNDNYFKNMLANRLKNDTCVNGLKELLRYADRNSMAHSREIRLPFLSHKLVEFIFSLPMHYLLNKGWTKFILRTVMNPILPKSICWRVDKIGYEPPQKNWIDDDYYHDKIEQTAHNLDVKKINESDIESDFNQDWRLLMASIYL